MDKHKNMKDPTEAAILNDESSESINCVINKPNSRTSLVAPVKKKAVEKVSCQEIRRSKKLLQNTKDSFKNAKLMNNNKETPHEKPVNDEEINRGIASASIDTILNNAFQEEYLKPLIVSRMKCLKDEILTLIKQSVDREDTIALLEKRLKDTERSLSEHRQENFGHEKRYEKLVKESDETGPKYEEAQRQLSAANSQIEELKYRKREHDARKSDLERQLTQMTAQNNKLKAEIQELKQTQKDKQELSQKQVNELKSGNKLLSKQKAELIEVVSKQMKLIHNLKRQILHFKANIVQKFTEDEVKKSIESCV